VSPAEEMEEACTARGLLSSGSWAIMEDIAWGVMRSESHRNSSSCDNIVNH